MNRWGPTVAACSTTTSNQLTPTVIKLEETYPDLDAPSISVQMKRMLASQKDLDERLSNTLRMIPARKTAVNLVSDYMTQLVVNIKLALQSTYPASLYNQSGDSIPIKYVLTVPAV